MAPRRPHRKSSKGDVGNNDGGDDVDDDGAADGDAEEEVTARSTKSRSKRRSNHVADDAEQPANAAAAAFVAAVSNVVQRRSVSAAVRNRQRAVAEREAGRLARPEVRRVQPLAHADTSKSAVASTPSGVLKSSDSGGVDGSAAGSAAPVEEWCGPFSVARQLIAKREEAKRLREEEEKDDQMNHPLDEAMQELELQKKRKLHPSMQWKASFASGNSSISGNTSSSFYAKRQKRVDLSSSRFKIPSLFDMCVSFLIDNFEHVESLGVDMDSTVRTAIARELIAAHKLDGVALNVLGETGIDALDLADCSNLTEVELSDRLAELVTAGLRYLVLDQCGRCFTKQAVDAVVEAATKSTQSASLSSSDDAKRRLLVALSIGGAYALQDDDAAKLVRHLAPSTLEFKACNLLGNKTCASIAETFKPPNMRLIELALEDIPLSTADLQVLTTEPDALAHLKSLSLRRIDGLDDAVVVHLLQLTCTTLEGLDLTDNHQLTDAILAGMRLHDTRRLHSLHLSGLTQLTAVGLEAFFTTVEGATPPPMLRTLSLSKCDYQAVTDDVVRLATLAATQNRRETTDVANIAGSNASQAQTTASTLLGGGLVHLDLQGATEITDVAMEHVASTSSRTLQVLNVSFCTHVSDRGLGYLVDKCGKQLHTVAVWGNAQLSDDFFDGHLRCKDPSLEVVGVWMKNNTSRTIR